MHKFRPGDHVKIKKDLGNYMKHFTSDCEAVILKSGEDIYEKERRHENHYVLYIRGKGSAAWYDESQLTLIKRDSNPLLKAWMRDRLK